MEAASVGQFNNIYEQEEAVIDVFLLDVYLPDGNGFDVCRKIREHGSQIIIFLTSCDDEDSIIKGLDCGGDDYVVKPFRVAELVSRIMANVRRISGGTDIYKDGTLTVDFKNKSIIHADKQDMCVSDRISCIRDTYKQQGTYCKKRYIFPENVGQIRNICRG